MVVPNPKNFCFCVKLYTGNWVIAIVMLTWFSVPVVGFITKLLLLNGLYYHFHHYWYKIEQHTKIFYRCTKKYKSYITLDFMAFSIIIWNNIWHISHICSNIGEWNQINSILIQSITLHHIFVLFMFLFFFSI